MTPEARIQAAIDLLETVAATGRPADGTASAFFRDRRYIGSKDRRAVAERMWGVLRRWARLAWWVREAAAQTWAKAGEQPTYNSIAVRARVIADLVLTDRLGLDEIEHLFTGEGHAPRPLNFQEKLLIKALAGKKLEASNMPTWVRGEVPDWIARRVSELYHDHAEELLKALAVEAPVDLRVNTLKTDMEKAVAVLAAEGVEIVPTRWSPIALRMEARFNLAATTTFRDGLVEVQDEGSQLVALLADARPGMAVVDFCAGAGGKTLALAARMENKGRLVACDVSQGRLDRSAERMRRAGVHNVTRRVLENERDKWVKRSARSYDRVLVDAPCSGSGTWRRNPDAKWRLTEETLANLGATQANILDSAARLVKPGGRLVYATCSLLPEENEAQIDRFLEKNAADFRILPVSTLWPEIIGTDCPVEGSYLRLDPARHGTDGFFVAVLERVV